MYIVGDYYVELFLLHNVWNVTMVLLCRTCRGLAMLHCAKHSPSSHLTVDPYTFRLVPHYTNIRLFLIISVHFGSAKMYCKLIWKILDLTHLGPIRANLWLSLITLLSSKDNSWVNICPLGSTYKQASLDSHLTSLYTHLPTIMFILDNSFFSSLEDICDFHVIRILALMGLTCNYEL